ASDFLCQWGGGRKRGEGGRGRVLYRRALQLLFHLQQALVHIHSHLLQVRRLLLHLCVRHVDFLLHCLLHTPAISLRFSPRTGGMPTSFNSWYSLFTDCTFAFSVSSSSFLSASVSARRST